MKKNVMMRVASIMLVLVLMSSSVISGTFAKYVSSGSGTDTARVAKWGVQVQGFDGMFSQTYAKDDDTADEAVVGSNTVISSTDEKVVAPGTTGKMAEINVTGIPEVAVKVTYAASDVVLANWVDNEGNFYCPIIINVNGTALCGLDYATPEAFATAITDVIASKSESYPAHTDLSNTTVQNNYMDITWEWPFEGTVDYLANDQTDVKDTFLGDWVLRGDAYKPVISMKVTCTITQVD